MIITTRDTVLKFRNEFISSLGEGDFLVIPKNTKIYGEITGREKSHLIVPSYLYEGHVRVDKPSDQIAPGFRMHEFSVSNEAARRGIDNTPPPWAEDNISKLVINTLVPIRRWARERDPDAVVRITSGYRSQALNKAIGGAARSHHLFGRAADFVIPGVSPSQIRTFVLNSDIPFAELITYRTFTHIAYHEGHNNRRNFFK